MTESASKFMPHIWAPELLDQLKKQIVFRDFNAENHVPSQPEERYTLVHEGSYLSAVVEDDVTAFVPDEEAEEATRVMIDALNEWITAKRNEPKLSRN